MPISWLISCYVMGARGTGSVQGSFPRSLGLYFGQGIKAASAKATRAATEEHILSRCLNAVTSLIGLEGLALIGLQGMKCSLRCCKGRPAAGIDQGHNLQTPTLLCQWIHLQ